MPTFITCPCNHCRGNLEFDEDYVGAEIQCPHCALMTRLYRPTAQSPAAVAPPILTNSVGDEIPQGKWVADPMTEKQKAMFVLYGISLKEGLTKGDASKLIEQAKAIGIEPTEQNRAKAEKLFQAIDKKETKEKLESFGKEIVAGIKTIQSKKTTLEQMERLKDRFEEMFSDLEDIMQTRLDEIEEEEYRRQDEEE